ncbi:MAG TPA: hypothetical protein VFR07_01205 [Mycobacteriales bacterium]|jgi:hypothetical protein|nr:hypothetical protein [Mycobacteriales bacterium]
MQARRRLAVALAASVALVGLTGCEKPTPIVTLYSGSTSLYDEALSFCFEGQDPATPPGTDGACRYEERSLKILEVRPGDEVTVDVDKDLADAAWFVALRGTDDRSSRLATQEEHVTSFQPDFSVSPTFVLEVQKLESAAEGAKTVGVWRFTLVPG